MVVLDYFLGFLVRCLWWAFMQLFLKPLLECVEVSKQNLIVLVVYFRTEPEINNNNNNNNNNLIIILLLVV